MYTIDNCPNLHCGRCKYYNAKADLDGEESICKRIDHKKVKFAVPPFKSYDCGYHHLPCGDFEPRCPEQADFAEWTNFEDFWKVFVDAWSPYGNINTTLGFTINGNTDVRYNVHLMDFVNGTMFDEEGRLKAVEKVYYKQVNASKNGGLPFRLVREPCGSVEIKKGSTESSKEIKK